MSRIVAHDRNAEPSPTVNPLSKGQNVSNQEEREPVRVIIELPDARCVANVDAMTDVAQAAEELGFYGIAVGDHLLADPKMGTCAGFHDGDDRVFYEPLQVLSYIAARTSRVKLLTSVIVLPNRHPVLLAKQVATLDQLSRGRVILGLGAGALPQRKSDAGFDLSVLGNIAAQEYQAYGVRGHRGRLTDEYVAVLENMWMNETSTFDGPTIKYAGMQVYPKPLQTPRPPIWWGGRALVAQRRVAEIGDGWLPSQCPVDIFADGVAKIRELATAADRPIPVDFGVSLWCAIDDTDAKAGAAARVGIGSKFADEAALHSGTFIGSPETIVSRMNDYRNAGLNLAVLRCIPPTAGEIIRQLELINREVLPALV